MAPSSFSHSTVTVTMSSNATDPSSRDERAGDVNQSAISVSDAKCATRWRIVCCVQESRRWLERLYRDHRQRPFADDKLSTWSESSNQLGHTKATNQESPIKFSPRFGPPPDYSPSINGSMKTQPYAHLLRRHTINHDIVDTESASKSKFGVQLRPQLSSFDLSSPDLTSPLATSQTPHSQNRYRFPGTLADESSCSPVNNFSGREMAVPLSPVKAATRQPPPMRPNIKEPAIESEYQKHYAAMTRDAPSAATLALRSA